MKFLQPILGLQAFASVYAASGCQRDSCYNAVAVQNKQNPKLAVRKADCSYVLRTVIDDDKTVTITTIITKVPTMTVTFDTTTTEVSLSTITETEISTISKTSISTISETTVTTATETEQISMTYIPRAVASPQITQFPKLSSINEDTSQLEERDIFIVAGQKPSYAAACKNLQQYATACLCFGVKASTYRILPRTKTVRLTVTAASTATITSSVTEIVTNFITTKETSLSTVVETSFTTVTATNTVTVEANSASTSAFWRDVTNNQVLVRDFDAGALAAQTNSEPPLSITFNADSDPYLTLDPTYYIGVYRSFTPDFGTVEFSTVQYNPPHEPIRCSVDADGFIKCQTVTGVLLSYFYRCSQGPIIYLGAETLGIFGPFCSRIQVKLDTAVPDPFPTIT